jgi:hypothetical protein
MAALLVMGAALASGEIVSFKDKLIVSSSLTYRMVGLREEQPGESEQLWANQPLIIGLRARYKVLSLGFEAALPFFRINERPWSQYYNLSLNHLGSAFMMDGSFMYYRGFYVEDPVVSTRDMDIRSTGLWTGWMVNRRNHSLRAAYQLEQKQTASSGSVIFGYGSYYSTMASHDNRVAHYADRQHFLYGGPSFGYSFTWVPFSNWFANAYLNLGINLGFHPNRLRLLFIPQAVPKLALGYHHDNWSLAVNGSGNLLVFLWGMNDFDFLMDSKATLLFSKRFDLPTFKFPLKF